MVRIAPGTRPWDALMEAVLDVIEGKADTALAGLPLKLSKAANLADLDDFDAARGFLDVYTKGEADTLFAAGNGITDIVLDHSTGLVDTYKISFDSTPDVYFDIRNGRGITSIVLQSTVGLVKTYRVTYTDASTFDFTITNGLDGTPGTDGVSISGIALQSTAGTNPVVKTYRISRSNGSYFDMVVTDGIKGDIGDTGATPTLRATSTTSLAIAAASKTWGFAAMPVAFPVGMVLRATSDSDPSAYMCGMVTAATTTSVTINVTEIGGAGTKADWTIVLGAFRGTQGPQGSPNIFGPAGSVPGPYADGIATYEY